MEKSSCLSTRSLTPLTSDDSTGRCYTYYWRRKVIINFTHLQTSYNIDLAVIFVHLYNSDTNVRISKHFLIYIKAHSMRRNSNLKLLMGPRTREQIGHRFREKLYSSKAAGKFRFLQWDDSKYVNHISRQASCSGTPV